jgi:hypothetical protein
MLSTTATWPWKALTSDTQVMWSRVTWIHLIYLHLCVVIPVGFTVPRWAPIKQANTTSMLCRIYMMCKCSGDISVRQGRVPYLVLRGWSILLRPESFWGTNKEFLFVPLLPAHLYW